MTESITVLMINSNSDDRENFKQLLASGDQNAYRVIETDTGTNALELMSKTPIDCILTDQDLPDMKSVELLNAVNRKTNPHLPVIILTGNEDGQIPNRASKLRASEYLAKDSLSAALLSNAVQRAIARRDFINKSNRTDENLWTILNAIPNPVFLVDAGNKIAGCNRAFSDFTGKQGENLDGMTLNEIFPIELADRLMEFHQHFEASPLAVQHEATMTNGKGEPVDIVFHIAHRCDACGMHQGSVMTLLHSAEGNQINASHKKDALNEGQTNPPEIPAQNPAVEERQLKVLLQLVGSTAHELNQPLMTLLGNIELISMSRDDPKQITERISLIEKSGHRIAQIVKKFQEIRHNQTMIQSTDSSIVKFDQQLTVMVVEDNDRDYKKLSQLLKTCGPVTVTRAKGVDEGYNLLIKNEFDLIFLDFMLSSGNGLEFLSGMAERAIETPVVVITGQGDEIVASKVIQAGAYDYLPKSRLAIKPLARIIHNTLEKHRLKTQVAQAIKKMAELSTRDELTNLFNRRYFKDSLALEIARAERYGSTFTVMMIDLDYFKKVNDTMGHAAGDMVLKQTSCVLLDCLRESDVACRYGGEEFAVLLPNTTDEDGRQISERFRAALAGYDFQWNTHQFHITASIGLTDFRTADDDTAESLMQRSDEALYKAKTNGRNQIAVY